MSPEERIRLATQLADSAVRLLVVSEDYPEGDSMKRTAKKMLDKAEAFLEDIT